MTNPTTNKQLEVFGALKIAFFFANKEIECKSLLDLLAQPKFAPIQTQPSTPFASNAIQLPCHNLGFEDKAAIEQFCNLLDAINCVFIYFFEKKKKKQVRYRKCYLIDKAKGAKACYLASIQLVAYPLQLTFLIFAQHVICEWRLKALQKVVGKFA